jgi:hypothetical protein
LGHAQSLPLIDTHELTKSVSISFSNRLSFSIGVSHSMAGDPVRGSGLSAQRVAIDHLRNGKDGYN